MIPPETSRIIGVARSGLCAASLLSMLLHLPLSIVRQSTGDLIDGGNGWRLTGNTGGTGPPVIVDDTVMSGNSFKHILPIVWKTFPGAISAAIYVNPSARLKPDIHVRDLPWPHVLEWNVTNSIMTPSCGFDFDGILCNDCEPGQDDDGPRYIEFLRNAKPKYMVRRVHIPLIVTARLEKYRDVTVDWLNRHGMVVTRLVMGPWQTLAERQRHNMAEFKASHFAAFMRLPRPIKPAMFFESEPRQAQKIAEITGGLVVCPAAGRCFP